MPKKINGSWEIRLAMWRLIQAGKTEAEALDEVLPAKDSAGKRINPNRVRMFQAWQKSGLWPISSEELQQHGITGEGLGSEHAECSEASPDTPLPSERPEHSEDKPTTTDWEVRVRNIAREVCQEMIQNIQAIQNAENVPSIPTGEDPFKDLVTKGRSENRIYGKLGATIDGVLFRLLKNEARREDSIGKLIDKILWERYGRPLLSFQVPDEEKESLRKEFHKPGKKGRANG